MNQVAPEEEGHTQEQSASPSGVDLSLIRKYLDMTPTERLLAWYGAARLALELQKHAPGASDNP